MDGFSLIEFLSALLLGVPTVTAVFILQSRRFTILARVALVVCCIILFAVFAWLLHPAIQLASAEWWERSPWRHMIMYSLMMVGVCASILNKAIEERRREISRLKVSDEKTKIRIRLDGWDFVKGFLLSWITYSCLISQIGKSSLSVATAVIGIQTGFFWETVVGKQISERMRSARPT